MRLSLVVCRMDEIAGQSSTRDAAYSGECDEQIGELIAIPDARAECLVSAKPFILIFRVFYFHGDIGVCCVYPAGKVICGEPIFL